MKKTSRAFPVAAHSYFHVHNKESERRKFFEDATHQPVFSYGLNMNKSLVEKRLLKVKDNLQAQRSLHLVLASIELQKNPNERSLRNFRTRNKEMFGAPKKIYVDGLLARVRERVSEQTKPLWREIEQLIHGPLGVAPDVVPSQEIFRRYRGFFSDYSRRSFSSNATEPLPSLLAKVLHEVGLEDAGWRIVVRNDNSRAKVHQGNKTIPVGKLYAPRTRPAAARIVVHEVYGHALRGQQDSVAESEGFAILLEQLLDERFKFRRSYRYLAAGLGWGCMNREMNFREVYEIVWRAMVIIGTYDVKKAKGYAFDECARVFRGGRPDVAGAVYLKDSMYFDANVAMWRRLQNEPLEYNEFIDIIEGRRRVLT